MYSSLDCLSISLSSCWYVDNCNLHEFNELLLLYTFTRGLVQRMMIKISQKIKRTVKLELKTNREIEDGFFSPVLECSKVICMCSCFFIIVCPYKLNPQKRKETKKLMDQPKIIRKKKREINCYFHNADRRTYPSRLRHDQWNHRWYAAIPRPRLKKRGTPIRDHERIYMKQWCRKL